MPEDVQHHAQEPPHPHGPVHADVRHERRDARLWFVVLTIALLVAGAGLGHLVVYGLLGGLERRQEAQENRRPGLGPIARENRPHFPDQLRAIRERYKAPPLQVGDVHDMEELRAAEEARLGSYGWSDLAQGKVHIPIEEALRLMDDANRTKARGIVDQLPKGAQ
jgi:hypothetical protein